ncbi:histidine phosphatase family protein [Alicyclobacillus dauci]|uniref:Histidine phosphatase family protein n=1 Tax=Alicyclobacillus dauci TaxID=1475485 RepID=A0ABY6Z3D8_9BACL|nr:histidine phosphatase family protein [Alicyclobacillus dauci]WAH37270.1 histidine phosphatase family protein [Alicyclobacillus dauci]
MFVYLLRHGQTVYNADGERFCGSSDVGLTALGWQQARKTATLLRDVRLEKIIYSGLRRSRETARAILEVQNHLTERDLQIEPAFREVGFGEWEGLTRVEVAKAFPELYPEWLVDPVRTHIPGGESLRERHAEVLTAFHAVTAQGTDGDIAIVAHNTINRLLLVGLFGGDAGRYRKLVQRNACLNVIERTDLGDIRVHAINMLPLQT